MPDTTEAKETKNKEQVAHEAVKTSPPWPLITIGVFGTVVVLAVFMIGWGFIAADRAPGTMRQLGVMNQRGMRSQSGGMSDGSGRGFGFRRGGMMQSAVANGVITAVNGDTLTVSGQGKQVTVKKTDSTTIAGDKSSVAVNDTVVVYGTTESDGSVDATKITVRNESGTAGMGQSSDDSAMLPPGA